MGSDLCWRMAETLYNKTKSDTTTYRHDHDQVITPNDENDNLLRKFACGPGIDESIMVTDMDGETETKYY